MHTIQFFLFIFACLIGFAGFTYMEIMYVMNKLNRESSVRYLCIFSFIVTLFALFLLCEYYYFHRGALTTGWSPVEKTIEVVMYMAIFYSWLKYVRKVTGYDDSLIIKITDLLIFIDTIIMVILNSFYLDNHYHTDKKLVSVMDTTFIMLVIATIAIIVIIYLKGIAYSTISKKLKNFIIIESVLITINFAWNNLYTIQLIHQRYIFGDFYTFSDLDFTSLLFLLIISLSLITIRTSAIDNLRKHSDIKSDNQMEISDIRRVYSLTPRETEVLELIIKNASYGEICSELHVSINTVKKHVNNLYRKVGVTSKSELFVKFHM